MLYVDADGGAQAPQLRIDIDQRRALALGLDLDDVNATLATAWGGSYVNDFLYRGQVRKVFVQAEAPYRAGAADLGRWYVRGASGAMTPLSAFASARWDTGPEQLRRFNGLPAVQVTAAGVPGMGTGTLMDDVERIAAALPDTVLAWSGLSYQERMANAQAPLLYAASALFVFLCLAALYGRWTIPFAVLLAMPLGVIGAVAAAWMAGMSRDIFFQVAVLTTAGLSAKNAVLVVEAAQARLEEGASALAAVHAAACERLRPILMTSLAFGAGIVPLLFAGGPGAGVQRALGTGVLGGVAAATVLGVFLIPLCYLLVARRPRAAASAAGSAAALPALD
jgi:multidrug efflux pump